MQGKAALMESEPSPIMVAAVKAESGRSVAAARSNAAHLPVFYVPQGDVNRTLSSLDFVTQFIHVDDGEDQLIFGNHFADLRTSVVASSSKPLQRFAFRVHLVASREMNP